MIARDPNKLTWTQVSNDPFDAIGQEALPREDGDIIVSTDLGKNADRTAICVLKSSIAPVQHYRLVREPNGGAVPTHRETKRYFDVLDVFSPPLGTAYLDVARLIADVRLQARRAYPDLGVLTCFDQSGVGVGVGELLRTVNGIRQAIGITITGSLDSSPVWCDPGTDITVGKAPLLGELHRAISERRVTFHRFPQLRDVLDELKSFTRTPTASGREKLEAGTGMDDMVLGLSLGVYCGTYQRPPARVSSLLNPSEGRYLKR